MKNNYNKQYRPTKTEPVVEETVEETVEVTEPSKEEPTYSNAYIVDCSSLNIRCAPSIDADIMCSVGSRTSLQVELAKSTDDWFKVCTPAGIDGYCMRKYVRIKGE